jgi:hypothetical protein
VKEKLGSEWLSIHLSKQCSACLKDIKQMLSDEKSNFDAPAPRGETLDDGVRVPVEDNVSDATTSRAEPSGAILATEPPEQHAPVLPELIEWIKIGRSLLGNLLTMTEEEKAERRRNLFISRQFYFKDLIDRDENGNVSYTRAIEQIKFVEECLKDLRTVHQAEELAKRNFISEQSATIRARLREEDKKYEPKFKEREKIEKEKMTGEEKKIRNFMKLGLSRETAEKIIFAKS